MKRIIFLLLTGVFLSAICLAQTDPQSTGSAAQPGSAGAAPSATQPGTAATQAGNAASATSPVQSGSIIYAELSKSVDAKKAKVGDELQAKTTQAVLSQGRVVIPKGSKLLGHVTQANARTSDQQPSQLGISFDHAVLKDGTQVPLSVSVQALGGGASAAPYSMDQPPSSGGANQGPSSPGMPGRAPGEAAGGYGAPSGMGSSSAGAGTTAGGMASSEAGPSAVHLNAGSRGVVGISGLRMAEGPQGAVVTSDKKNVKLDSGIELVLKEK